MSYALVPIDAGGGPPITLVRPVLLVGRHPECDVRINLPKISRRHCCVVLAYDRVLIRDLGSHNGIRVNGRRVEESRLYPRDEVAIGPLIYRLVAEGGEETAGPPASTGEPARRTSSTAGKAPEQPLPDDPDDIGLVPMDSF